MNWTGTRRLGSRHVSLNLYVLDRCGSWHFRVGVTYILVEITVCAERDAA